MILDNARTTVIKKSTLIKLQFIKIIKLNITKHDVRMLNNVSHCRMYKHISNPISIDWISSDYSVYFIMHPSSLRAINYVTNPFFARYK